MSRRSTAKPKTRTKAKRATKPKPAPTVRIRSAEGLGIEEKADGDLTPKQEAFCHAYVETSNASEAYRRAYDCSNMKDETIWRNAHELLNHNSKVATRVAQLRDGHRKRHDITIDDLVAELEEARTIAKKAEAAAPMVAATMGKGKLLGLVVDKAEHSGRDGKDLLPIDPSSRDIARAVIDILRQAKLEGQPHDPSAIDGELAAESEPSGGEPHALPGVTAAENVVAADTPRTRIFAAGRLT
jgi:phage terminase small subunit